MLHFGNIPIIKKELRDITQMTNCYTIPLSLVDH